MENANMEQSCVMENAWVSIIMFKHVMEHVQIMNPSGGIAMGIANM